MSTKFLFQVFPSSGVPLYRQLMDQILTMIGSGKLVDGDFLPSVRETAEGLEINPMTVSKAYSQLEQKGVLELIRGKGMRINTPKLKVSPIEKINEVTHYFEQAFAQCFRLSMSQQEVLTVIKPMLDQFPKTTQRKGKS